MNIREICLERSILEGIARALGDTDTGLTGSEIQRLFAQSQIVDTDPMQTKWKRLYFAFSNDQNKNQCSNNVLNFIKYALPPVKHVEDVEEKRRLINQQLSSIGYQYNEVGNFIEIRQASTIIEAQIRAYNLKTRLEQQNAHKSIFFDCKADLLDNNYSHSIFEATKRLFKRIQALSKQNKIGDQLIEAVFCKNPILIINNYKSKTEKEEQDGFCHLLKGLSRMFRHPTARKLKIITEQDALEILLMISYCHRRLDHAHKIR